MSPLRPNEKHPSFFELEGWLSGESSHRTPTLKEHLSACPDCQAQLASMQTQAERFRFRNPTFEALAARRVRPSAAYRFKLWLSRFAKPAIALASLAVVGAALFSYQRLGQPADYGLKGSSSFLLFDAKQNRYAPMDTVLVRMGDTLQLALSSHSTLYYRIFSRSAEGKVTELMPLPGEPDTLPASSRGTPLPHSLIFSDSVNRERILCLWSRKPLDWKTARALLGSSEVTQAWGIDSFEVAGAR